MNEIGNAKIRNLLLIIGIILFALLVPFNLGFHISWVELILIILCGPMLFFIYKSVERMSNRRRR
jgi:hypothetical protein